MHLSARLLASAASLGAASGFVGLCPLSNCAVRPIGRARARTGGSESLAPVCPAAMRRSARLAPARGTPPLRMSDGAPQWRRPLRGLGRGRGLSPDSGAHRAGDGASASRLRLWAASLKVALASRLSGLRRKVTMAVVGLMAALIVASSPGPVGASSTYDLPGYDWHTPEMFRMERPTTEGQRELAIAQAKESKEPKLFPHYIGNMTPEEVYRREQIRAATFAREDALPAPEGKRNEETHLSLGPVPFTQNDLFSRVMRPGYTTEVLWDKRMFQEFNKRFSRYEKVTGWIGGLGLTAGVFTFAASLLWTLNKFISLAKEEEVELYGEELSVDATEKEPEELEDWEDGLEGEGGDGDGSPPEPSPFSPPPPASDSDINGLLD